MVKFNKKSIEFALTTLSKMILFLVVLLLVIFFSVNNFTETNNKIENSSNSVLDSVIEEAKNSN